MAKVPKKVMDRFVRTIGGFQRVLADAKDVTSTSLTL